MRLKAETSRDIEMLADAERRFLSYLLLPNKPSKDQISDWREQCVYNLEQVVFFLRGHDKQSFDEKTAFFIFLIALHGDANITPPRDWVVKLQEEVLAKMIESEANEKFIIALTDKIQRNKQQAGSAQFIAVPALALEQESAFEAARMDYEVGLDWFRNTRYPEQAIELISEKFLPLEAAKDLISEFSRYVIDGRIDLQTEVNIRIQIASPTDVNGAISYLSAIREELITIKEDGGLHFNISNAQEVPSTLSENDINYSAEGDALIIAQAEFHKIIRSAGIKYAKEMRSAQNEIALAIEIANRMISGKLNVKVNGLGASPWLDDFL